MTEASDQHDQHEGAADERTARLAAGLARVRAERSGGVDHRALAVAAAVLVPVGVVLVLVGWRGAARTPNVYEQIPYLISGAELGQTLAVVGALCYFAHWLTVLVHEHRSQSAALLAAVDRVADALERLAPPPAAAGGTEEAGAVLVATARGRLAHRPDCRLVAGRAGLHEVAADDGFARCQLCLESS